MGSFAGGTPLAGSTPLNVSWGSVSNCAGLTPGLFNSIVGLFSSCNGSLLHSVSNCAGLPPELQVGSQNAGGGAGGGDNDHRGGTGRRELGKEGGGSRKALSSQEASMILRASLSQRFADLTSDIAHEQLRGHLESTAELTQPAPPLAPFPRLPSAPALHPAQSAASASSPPTYGGWKMLVDEEGSRGCIDEGGSMGVLAQRDLSSPLPLALSLKQKGEIGGGGGRGGGGSWPTFSALPHAVPPQPQPPPPPPTSSPSSSSIPDVSTAAVVRQGGQQKRSASLLRFNVYVIRLVETYRYTWI
jgi:hypothetical protein